MSNHRSHSFTDGKTRIAIRLVVHPTHTYDGYVLSWDFGDGTAVGAEGECSRKIFKRVYEAKRYARYHYDEKAVFVSHW